MFVAARIEEFNKETNSLLCAYQWFALGSGGPGQLTGIRFHKAHIGGDFDIHNGPKGGKFGSTAMLES